MIIEEMKRCLFFKPHNLRITKWRLSYEQAVELAGELAQFQMIPCVAKSEILEGLLTHGGNALGIPVAVRLSPGMAYPLYKAGETVSWMAGTAEIDWRTREEENRRIFEQSKTWAR